MARPVSLDSIINRFNSFKEAYDVSEKGFDFGELPVVFKPEDENKNANRLKVLAEDMRKFADVVAKTYENRISENRDKLIIDALSDPAKMDQMSKLLTGEVASGSTEAPKKEVKEEVKKPVSAPKTEPVKPNVGQQARPQVGGQQPNRPQVGNRPQF